MAEAVAAGQIGGRQTVRGGEGHLDAPGRRQVGAKPWAGLTIESGERAHYDGVHRQLVFLQDDKADATAGGRVDAVPAEEPLHRGSVMRLIGLPEIVGEGTEAARIPPTPNGDQRDAEQKARQRRGEATKPRMPEEELQHEGEGR